MMYSYPFYGFPRRFYSYRPYYPSNNLQSSSNNNNLNSQAKKETKVELTHKTENRQKEIPHTSQDDSIFEIFGIKLYYDDLLLICLIFFLYNEGVQDQFLFITLVLLLLS